MSEQEPDNRRFGLIRDVGESVVDAAKSVTGSSATEKISEFTDVYTEIVTGLDGDVQALRRRTSELESEFRLQVERQGVEVTRLKRNLRSLLVLTVSAVVIGIAAIVLGLVT